METLADIVNAAVADRCAEYPEWATFLGVHEHDHRLSYPTPAAAHRRRSDLLALLERLDAFGPEDGDVAATVDRQILATETRSELLLVTDLDEAAWNPMLHNPGQALYSLLFRDFAPLEIRAAALTGRLRSVPDYLAAARERLTDLSAIHTETAIGQLTGTLGLIESEIPPVLARAGVAFDVGPAAEAVREHQRWLADRLPTAHRTSRLGLELFARKLALTLATPWQPQALLDQAYADLARAESTLRQAVADRTGRAPDEVTRETVAGVFDSLAEDAPTSDTILRDCRDALAETTEFVQRHELLTLLHDPVEVIEMPEIDRGVAVAYCRDVGALEAAPLLTQFAVSPTPQDWDDTRVASFYREYNRHMLHNLAVHEAMPGHVEQLSHSRRYSGDTVVRSVFRSTSFIEGWAVYAEELMADTGYRSDVSAEAAFAVRMQQLKMQLRTILNAILDISYHCFDLDEAGALELMTARGFQEDGEAAGKWRRVQLSSTQLSTYYVGYLEVRQLVADLRAAHPDRSTRQVHDAVLGFGSPPVRQLRILLGLPE